MSSQQTIQPNYSNDFDYPSFNRNDLMTLDTIRNRDFPIRKLNQINTNRDWSTNLYNLDIEKSIPNKTDVYINKVDYINKNDDIEKSQPLKEKIWHKPDFCLNIRDIYKAYPNKPKTDRHTDPLNPVYKLPSFPEAPPPTPLKFIRDQLDISDIDKAKPNKLFPMKMRPPKNYDEIGNNHPKKPYERKQFYDSLNYNDVTNKQKKFRNTNPLDPDYGNYGGFIEGSKSYQYKNMNKNSLNINDILGTNPGSANNYSNFRYDNKQRFDTRDIDGATADTKKHGICTLRCTNPLQPNYQYIGRSENLDCYGKIEDYDEKHYRRHNYKLSLPSVINNCENISKNDFFNVENKNDNVDYSKDSQPIINQKKSINKKIIKSRSCVGVNPYNKLGNNKNYDDGNLNSLPFSTISNENNNYRESGNFFRPKHDPTIILSKVNKDNRLDYKLKKYFNQNAPIFRNNILNSFNSRTTEQLNNRNDDLYQEFNPSKPNTYEEQLASVIKSSQIPSYY